MNSLRKDYFLVKLRIYNPQDSSLSPVIPAIYPSGQSLCRFIKNIIPDLKDKELKFFTDRNSGTISSISSGNPVSVYYHILCVIGGNVHESKDFFLKAIPEETINRITSFLSSSLNQLESSTGIFVIKKLTIPSDILSSYKGIVSLQMTENSMILKYYYDHEIGAYEIDINKVEKPIQRFEIRFFKDIASQEEEFRFHEIRSVIERDKYIFVDHINNRKGRELKTFIIEDSQGHNYRDTGNRILPMILLEETNQPALDIGFIIKNLYPHEELEILRFAQDKSGFMNKLLRAVKGDMCDVLSLNPETEEYYLLTWHRELKEGRIYYSCIEERIPDKPLVIFTNPRCPRSFAYLRTMNAFLISFAGNSELYFIEPVKERVQPQSIGTLFAENDESFAVYGEVKDLYSQSILSDSNQDILVIVQERKIGIYRIEEKTDLP